MKRDQVAKALEPFKEADIEIDILQLSPVSLANVVMFDQLPKLSEVDPEAPPPSIVLASMGVDSTDLLPEDAVELVPCAGLVFVQPTGPKNRSYVTFFSCIVSGCDWLLLALFWL